MPPPLHQRLAGHFLGESRRLGLRGELAPSRAGGNFESRDRPRLRDKVRFICRVPTFLRIRGAYASRVWCSASRRIEYFRRDAGNRTRGRVRFPGSSNTVAIQSDLFRTCEERHSPASAILMARRQPARQDPRARAARGLLPHPPFLRAVRVSSLACVRRALPRCHER